MSIIQRSFFTLCIAIFCFFAVFVPGALADDMSERLSVALDYYSKGQYDKSQYNKAISELQDAIRKYPAHAKRNEAEYCYARCLLELGRTDEALQHFDIILKEQLSAFETIPMEDFVYPEFYNERIKPKMSFLHKDDYGYGRMSLFKAGEASLFDGEIDRARKILFSYICEFPNDSQNAYTMPYLGDIAKQNYSLAVDHGYIPIARSFAMEAEEYFSQSVKYYKNGVYYDESLLGLAWACARLGKYDQAMPIFRQLASGTSDQAEEAYYEWGLMLYEQGNYEQAISTLNSFEKLYSKNSEFWHDSLRTRAKSLSGLSQYGEAISLINSLPKNLLSGEDVLVEVRCLLGLKRPDDAAKVLAELAKSSLGETVKDRITSLQAAQEAGSGNYAKAVSMLDELLRPKYNSRTRPPSMAFEYYDPPTPSKFGQNSQTISQQQQQSTLGKLSEENFLKACAVLCVAYANVGQTDKSNAVLQAMVDSGKSDDERHSHIIIKTKERLAQVGQNGGSGIGTGAIVGGGYGDPLPIDPGADGGMEFGPIATISPDDIQPIGGAFDPNSGGNRWGGSNKNPNTGRPNRTNPGDRYGNSSNPDDVTTGMINDLDDKNNSIKNSSDQKRVLQNCWALVNAKKWDEADKRLLALLSSNPLPAIGAEAAMLRTKVLLNLGREDEANTMCELILSQYKNSDQHAEALWISGQFYEMEGNPTEAIKNYKTIVEDYPNYEFADGALFHLGWDSLDLGYESDAIRFFNKIYKNYPDKKYWCHGTWGLAYIAYNKGETQLAEKYIQEILNNPPDESILDRVLYLKGQLAMKRGDWVVAQAAFSTLASKCKDSPLLSSARSNAAIARTNLGNKSGNDSPRR